MAKSEKYLLMESLAKSLREERNQMFKEIIRLRDEIKDLKDESRYIYVVKDYYGQDIAHYRKYENAIKRIEDNEKEIVKRVEVGLFVFAPASAIETHLFYLGIKEFAD